MRQSMQLAIVRDRPLEPFALTNTCPKCGASFMIARACPRCGLAKERMNGYVRREEPVVDALSHAWRAVTENWTSSASHDELLRLTTQHGSWAWTAARYRELARSRGEDVIVVNQLRRLEKGIVVSAFTRIESREDKGPKPYRAATTMLVVLIVLLVAGFFYGTTVKKTVAKPGAHATLPIAEQVR
jgi:hypothetical protein